MEDQKPNQPKSSSFEKIEHVNNDEKSESKISSDQDNELIKTNVNTVCNKSDSARSDNVNKKPGDNSKDYLEINNDDQSESIGHQISRLSNLDLTISEKKIIGSDAFNITNTNANVNLKELAQYSSDQIELQYQNNKVTENAQNDHGYQNENIYSKVNFTESVGKRFDDYKTTSNFQKLIEEEILKEKVSLPVLPESVINPKKIETKKEPKISNLENEESYESDLSQKNNEEEEKDIMDDIKKEQKGHNIIESVQVNAKTPPNDNENNVVDNQEQNNIEDVDSNEKQHRHLTMIEKKSRITELNADPNLTLLELANDLYSQRKTALRVPEEEIHNVEDNDQDTYQMIGRVTVTNPPKILEEEEHKNEAQFDPSQKSYTQEEDQIKQEPEKKQPNEQKESENLENDKNQENKSIHNK